MNARRNGETLLENMQVLIIGAGIAGLSAAIWCERLGLSYVIIERERTIGGQLTQIQNKISDFPPKVYANGQALLDELARHEVVHSMQVRCDESIVAVDVASRHVATSKAAYKPAYMILATGIRPNQLPVLQHVGHVLEADFSTTAHGKRLHAKNVLVIGGGDRAVESVINLSGHADHIWLAVRGQSLRARSEWQERLHACSNVTILFETELIGVEETGRTYATLHTQNAPEPFTIEIDWILPRIGVRGNSEILPALRTEKGGFIAVDEHNLTCVDWIYAIGDVTNGPDYASLSLASGQAMKAVKHILLRTKETTAHV